MQLHWFEVSQYECECVYYVIILLILCPFWRLWPCSRYAFFLMQHCSISNMILLWILNNIIMIIIIFAHFNDIQCICMPTSHHRHSYTVKVFHGKLHVCSHRIIVNVPTCTSPHNNLCFPPEIYKWLCLYTLISRQNIISKSYYVGM